jgi:hypothetical protein
MGLQVEKVKKNLPEGETAVKNLAMLIEVDIIMSTSQQGEARRFRIDSASENPTCACFSQ